MPKKPTYEELEQKVAELEESKMFFENLLDMLPELVSYIDKNHKFKFGNNAYVDFFNINPASMTGLHPRDVLGDEAFREVESRHKAALSGQKQEYESTFRLPNGDPYYFRAHYLPHKEKDRVKGFLAVVQDITERKQAEEDLRVSEEKYRTLFETMIHGVVYQDAEGKIISANPSSEKILGLSIDQMQGRTSVDPRWKSIHEDGSEFPGETHPSMIALNTGRVEKDVVMGVFNPQEENYRWININAVPQFNENENKPYQVYTTFEDITERKHAEDALKESEERFRLLFDNAPLPYQSLDENGYFLEVNKRWIDLLGYRRSEVIGKSFADFLHPDWIGHFKENFPKFKSIGEILGVEFELRRKDGLYIWVSFDGKIRHDAEGAFIQTHCVFSDITEQRRLEKKIKEQDEALRQAQKMDALGTLAGGIAHEINNILGIIIGNTELADDDVPEWNPAKQCLEEIKTASMRAKDVVRQILSFTRKTPGERKPIQISTIVKEVLKLIRATIPTSIEIKQSILCHKELILGNPTEINQILLNLCANAAQAMPGEKGHLDVTLEAVNIDKKTASECEDIKPGDYVRLTVKDDGEGIDPVICDRVFDPYFTTKDIGEGIGMGLAIVYGLVKKHDGAIGLTSEVGTGTTVELLFPVVEGEVKEPVDEREIMPTGTERVLFVDDEPSLADMVRQMLMQLGYDVFAQTSSQKALDLFKEEPDRFDLVITDMAMPEMAGDELAEKLIKIRPNIPIILCSGHSERMNKETALKLGIKAYLLKPILKRNLSRIVRSVLDEREP